eukprot:EG_transcript_39794
MPSLWDLKRCPARVFVTTRFTHTISSLAEMGLFEILIQGNARNCTGHTQQFAPHHISLGFHSIGRFQWGDLYLCNVSPLAFRANPKPACASCPAIWDGRPASRAA